MRNAYLLVGSALLASAAVFLPSGCVTPIGAYCDEVCECLECLRSERRTCADVLEVSEKKASDKACSDAFNSYVTCAGGAIACAESVASVSGCEAEEDALYACSGDIGFGKSDCKAAVETFAKKYSSCGIDLPDGTGAVANCGDFQKKQLKCQADCVDSAKCDAITGEDGAAAVALTNCKESCP